MALHYGQPVIPAAESMHPGLQARHRGDRLAALAHFRAAVQADPAGIRPRFELARELAELGRPQEAENLLQAILKDVPDQPQARALLAHLGGLGGRAPRREAGQDACRRRRLPAQALCQPSFLGDSPIV